MKWTYDKSNHNYFNEAYGFYIKPCKRTYKNWSEVIERVRSWSLYRLRDKENVLITSNKTLTICKLVAEVIK